MTNEVITIDKDNYLAMAKVMGMSGESTSEKKQVSTLARLRINHTPIMGEEEVNGKMTKVEVVEVVLINLRYLMEKLTMLHQLR